MSRDKYWRNACGARARARAVHVKGGRDPTRGRYQRVEQSQFLNGKRCEFEERDWWLVRYVDVACNSTDTIRVATKYSNISKLKFYHCQGSRILSFREREACPRVYLPQSTVYIINHYLDLDIYFEALGLICYFNKGHKHSHFQLYLLLPIISPSPCSWLHGMRAH